MFQAKYTKILFHQCCVCLTGKLIKSDFEFQVLGKATVTLQIIQLRSVFLGLVFLSQSYYSIPFKHFLVIYAKYFKHWKFMYIYDFFLSCFYLLTVISF